MCLSTSSHSVLCCLFWPTRLPTLSPFFFFNDTATTEIYTLSLHDALPISCSRSPAPTRCSSRRSPPTTRSRPCRRTERPRSEEHTSELQSQSNLVCRLLLEKKNHRRPPTDAQAV